MLEEIQWILSSIQLHWSSVIYMHMSNTRDFVIDCRLDPCCTRLGITEDVICHNNLPSFWTQITMKLAKRGFWETGTTNSTITPHNKNHSCNWEVHVDRIWELAKDKFNNKWSWLRQQRQQQTPIRQLKSIFIENLLTYSSERPGVSFLCRLLVWKSLVIFCH